jgi:hypothetical protein
MAQHSEAYRVLLNLDENSFFSKHLYEFLIKVLLPLLEAFNDNKKYPSMTIRNAH